MPIVGETGALPRSRWDMNVANEDTDQEGSDDFTESGTITYAATPIPSGGFASGSADYTADTLSYHTRTGSFGGIANGAFTFVGFFKWDSFESTDFPISIGYGGTNSHRIDLQVSSAGGVQFARRSKTSSSQGATIGSALSTDTWYLLAIGHDPDSGQVFAYIDAVKYTLSDLGDYDFTESGTLTRAGGRNTSTASIDGFSSHVSFYLDHVMTTSEAQAYIDDGEIPFISGTFSSTAIKRLAFADVTEISDTRILTTSDITKDSEIRIKRLEFDDKSNISRVAIKRFAFADLAVLSDTAILGISMIDVLSDVPIKRLEFDDKFKLSFVAIQIEDNEITKLSDTRIKRLTGGIIGKESDAKIIRQTDVTESSDAAIFRAAFADVTTVSDTTIEAVTTRTKTSDTRIVVSTDLTLQSEVFIIYRTDITNLSDTLILNQIDAFKVSDARIIVTQDITPISDTRILKATDLVQLSSTRIKDDFNRIFLRSDTLILNVTDVNITSIAAIKRLSFNDVTVTSNVEIVKLTDITLSSDTAIQHQQETSENSMTTISVRTTVNQVSDTLIKGRFETTLTSGTHIDVLVLGTKVTLLSGVRIEKPDRPAVMVTSSVAISLSAKVTTTSGTMIKGNLGKQYVAVFRKVGK